MSRGRGRGELCCTVPAFRQVSEALIEAEHTEGWLVRCCARGDFLIPNDEFLEALGQALAALGPAPVLEVCAGDGVLATALQSVGVEVIATDANPPAGAAEGVLCLTAREALARYHPSVVLGSFVPIDARVDHNVLNDPGVNHYIVLNARLSGEFGASTLWSHPRWFATPLDEVTRWMICRHDVWLGRESALLRRGEAWLFSRTPDQ